MPHVIANADVIANAYEMADANAYDEEEILQYNLNLFVEAIDLIDAATILLSLKND